MKIIANLVPGRTWIASASTGKPSDVTTQVQPNSYRLRHRIWSTKLFLLLVFAILGLFFAIFAGRILVRDNPQKSDVIVVLAGDSFDERYSRGMELLRAGYGKHLFLDVASDYHYFGRHPTEYAADFLERDTGNMRPFVSVCPFAEDSTVSEAKYVALCLQPLHPTRVLLVTSDFHSARALSVFTNRLPQYDWSVAAARDPKLFSIRWWQHREWAKTTLFEWLRMASWYLVDKHQ